jgi:hypothetical protein
MESGVQIAQTSGKLVRTGRVLSGLVALFLVFDAVMKLIQEPHVLEAHDKLGYPRHLAVGLGVLLLCCTIVYAIPRTSVLGAILLTGYLGGAVSTHLRVGNPPFSLLFPVIFGALTWGGLYLRDGRLRALLPFRR